MLGLVLLPFSLSRDLRTLYISNIGDGDCFDSACNYTTASHVLMNGDVLIFEDTKVAVTSYPSPLSDLLHTSMFLNVTMHAKDGKTVIDGRFMAGESLFNVHSASRFCWAKFEDFTFTNFEKPVLIRIMAETPWPLIVFSGCSFVENKADIFNVKGGRSSSTIACSATIFIVR
jgi:hypothetical protein